MGQVLQLLKSIDSFGAPIALNFRGSSSFNTPCGGVITIFTSALVAWLLIALAIEMFMFESPTIQTYTKAEIPKEPVNLFDNKFIFSVFLLGFTNNTIDPRAGILEVAYTTAPSHRIPL